MKVRAPNGLILDVPDAIASGLVGSRNHPEWEYHEEETVSDPPPLGFDGAPKAYASKAEWVDYAVNECGWDREQAEVLTKSNLINSLSR